MRINLLDELSKKKVFTIEDAEQINHTNKGVLKVILSRLEKRKRMDRKNRKRKICNNTPWS